MLSRIPKTSDAIMDSIKDAPGQGQLMAKTSDSLDS